MTQIINRQKVIMSIYSIKERMFQVYILEVVIVNEKTFLTIIKVLSETLEKNEMVITCQKYEIEELKKTIDELSKKI